MFLNWSIQILVLVIVLVSSCSIKHSSAFHHRTQQLIPTPLPTILQKRQIQSVYRDTHYYHRDTPLQKTRTAVRLDTNAEANNQSDLLRKYKNRSGILEREIRSNARDLSLLNSKVKVLQDVVCKMKASNGALVEKIALLQGEIASMDSTDRKTTGKEEEERKERIRLLMEKHRIESEENIRLIQEMQEKLTQEEQKRILITKKCQDATAELELVSQKQEKESDNYETKCDEYRVIIDGMDVQLRDLNTEIGRLREVARKNDNTTDHPDLQKLKEELSCLESQIDLLECKCAEYETRVKDQSELYKNVRTETDRLLEEGRTESIALQKQIILLQNDKISMEATLNCTMVEIEKLREELRDTKTKVSSENEREIEQDVLRSKEAVLIATAAVQQSEERERDIKLQVVAMRQQIDNLTNERRGLRDFMTQTQNRYEKETGETEENHQEEIRKLEEVLGQVRENLVLQVRGNEEVIVRYEKEQLVADAKWERKLSKMEGAYEGVVRDLRLEIVRLTEGNESADLKADGQSSVNDDTKKKVGVKRNSLGARWLQIWFRKSHE